MTYVVKNVSLAETRTWADFETELCCIADIDVFRPWLWDSHIRHCTLTRHAQEGQGRTDFPCALLIQNRWDT